MMKKWLLLGILPLIFLGCGPEKQADEHTGNDVETASTATEDADEKGGWEKKTVVIHYDLHFKDSLSLFSFGPIRWKKDMTVMDAMEAARDLGMEFETKDVKGIGTFVNAIAGRENGSEGGKYWMYCVNDTSAGEGAGSRKLNPSDDVVWHWGLPKELGCLKIGE